MFNPTLLSRLSPILLLIAASAASPINAGLVWGPLEISVNSFTTTVAPGDVGHVGVAVENHSDALTLTVALRVNILYADGSQEILLLDSPFVLGTGTGFVQTAFFPVPQDVAAGTATISAQAVVTNINGGGTHGLARPALATDQDTFEVVAAFASSSSVNDMQPMPFPASQAKAVVRSASAGMNPRLR